MYKKIKNGSFMNWIWFIIATLPFVLLLIYTFSFFNDKNLEYNTKVTLYNKVQENAQITQQNLTYDETTNNYIINSETEKSTRLQILCTKKEIYFNVINKNNDAPISIIARMYNQDNTYEDLNFYNNPNELFYFNYNNNENFKTYRIIIQWGQQTINEYSILLYEQPFDMTLFNQNNNNYIEYPIETINIYEQYLENINNTIQTNGFISSAFLNLAILFGVNNVYYSLACYYIEYLLVIVLLHLAFDVLYMLPNICHKFMEKIGGERD